MATAAGMTSLFSSSINTVKCLRSKNSSLLDTTSNRMFVSLISQSSVEPLSIGTTVSHKLWFPRISVAVAQEEAVVAVEDEEKVVVEEEEKEKEEEVVEEEENGGETVAEVDTRTKLYFGNLPYSVDSAQLAGLIEEYGSAELIEVLHYLTIFNIHR